MYSSRVGLAGKGLVSFSSMCLSTMLETLGSNNGDVGCCGRLIWVGGGKRTGSTGLATGATTSSAAGDVEEIRRLLFAVDGVTGGEGRSSLGAARFRSSEMGGRILAP